MVNNNIIKTIGIIVLILFYSCTYLYSQSLILHHSSDSIKLERTDFSDESIVALQTTRISDEQENTDFWEGLLLSEILSEYGISGFDELVFNAADGYQVRLAKEDLESNTSLIAFRQNGESLELLRLIIPEQRDMYWIAGLTDIEIVHRIKPMRPSILYSADNILKDLPKAPHKLSYQPSGGYLFRRLISNKQPFAAGEYLLIGSDGLQRTLDYDKYLKNAYLIPHENGGYDLVSSDMPAGMWIKSIAYIQNKSHEFAFFFLSAFSSEAHFSKISAIELSTSKIKAYAKSGNLLENVQALLFSDEVIKIQVLK